MYQTRPPITFHQVIAILASRTAARRTGRFRRQHPISIEFFSYHVTVSVQPEAIL
jgi:hypothetical protein